jgi:hypothetical protein
MSSNMAASQEDKVDHLSSPFPGLTCSALYFEYFFVVSMFIMIALQS